MSNADAARRVADTILQSGRGIEIDDNLFSDLYDAIHDFLRPLVSRQTLLEIHPVQDAHYESAVGFSLFHADGTLSQTWTFFLPLDVEEVSYIELDDENFDHLTLTIRDSMHREVGTVYKWRCEIPAEDTGSVITLDGGTILLEYSNHSLTFRGGSIERILRHFGT